MEIQNCLKKFRYLFTLIFCNRIPYLCIYRPHFFILRIQAKSMGATYIQDSEKPSTAKFLVKLHDLLYYNICTLNCDHNEQRALTIPTSHCNTCYHELRNLQHCHIFRYPYSWFFPCFLINKRELKCMYPAK